MSQLIANLHDALRQLPDGRGYLLAYSGGRDSHVLLHAMVEWVNSAEEWIPLRAVHLDHGLQPHSHSWSEHCRQVCSALDLPIEIVQLEIHPEPGQSLEALARTQRYGALEDRLAQGEILLTAHHQGDQAETVLLQLLRGAGLSGLSAMPMLTAFGRGLHARPLLGVSREEVDQYAHDQGLKWIEDQSNSDPSFDRNYLRHQVIPILERRWPAMGRTISRSARHCAESQQLIDGLATQELKSLLVGESGTLSAEGLARLPLAQGRAVLRTWIREAGYPVPNAARLERMLYELPGAARDRNPVVRWPGAEMRRFRGLLHLMPPVESFDSDLVIPWETGTELHLPAGAGALRSSEGTGGIRADAWSSGEIEIRFRQQGIRCRPAGRDGSRSLKKLFQELGVPPWLRDRVPLIYIGDDLAAVADLVVCDPFKAGDEETSVLIRWKP